MQSEVNLVVRVLLLLVVFFGALITINQLINRDQDLLENVQAASVVFGLEPLHSGVDRAIIAGIVLVWMGTLRLVWRHRLVDRYLDVDLSRL